MKNTGSAFGGLMVVGLGVGAALGAAMNNIPAYSALGIVLGLIFGFGFDMSRRRKEQAGKDSQLTDKSDQ